MCGGPSPYAETRVPHAEDRFLMQRLVFRVRRTMQRLVFCTVLCMRRLVFACGGPSPHAETARCSANGELSFICTLYFFLRRLSSTPRRLHFNLVRLGIMSRVAGPRKGLQNNLDVFKIYGLVRFNWQAVVVAAFFLVLGPFRLVLLSYVLYMHNNSLLGVPCGVA